MLSVPATELISKHGRSIHSEKNNNFFFPAKFTYNSITITIFSVIFNLNLSVKRLRLIHLKHLCTDAAKAASALLGLVFYR